jgi:hypothetical protein
VTYQRYFVEKIRSLPGLGFEEKEEAIDLPELGRWDQCGWSNRVNLLPSEVGRAIRVASGRVPPSQPVASEEDQQ